MRDPFLREHGRHTSGSRIGLPHSRRIEGSDEVFFLAGSLGLYATWASCARKAGVHPYINAALGGMGCMNAQCSATLVLLRVRLSPTVARTGGQLALGHSRSTLFDGGYTGIGADSKDLACPLCGLCDDDLGLTVGSRELVVCKG